MQASWPSAPVSRKRSAAWSSALAMWVLRCTAIRKANSSLSFSKRLRHTCGGHQWSCHCRAHAAACFSMAAAHRALLVHSNASARTPSTSMADPFAMSPAAKRNAPAQTSCTGSGPPGCRCGGPGHAHAPPWPACPGTARQTMRGCTGTCRQHHAHACNSASALSDIMAQAGC